MSSFTSVSAQGPSGDAAAELAPGEAEGGPPLPQHPSGLSEFLSGHAVEAVTTLGQLLRLGPQSLPQNRMGQPSGLLPVAALQACQALMFMRTTKGGLGLSYSHGSGFLINKLSTEYDSAGGGKGTTKAQSGSSLGAPDPPGGNWTGGHAPPPSLAAAGPVPVPAPRSSPAPGPDTVPLIRWSAPCFYSLDSLSVGITLGIEQNHSVLLLWNEATLERVKAGRAVLGTDVHIMMGHKAEAEDASADSSGGRGDFGAAHLMGLGSGGLDLGVGGGGLAGGLSLSGVELPLVPPLVGGKEAADQQQQPPHHQQPGRAAAGGSGSSGGVDANGQGGGAAAGGGGGVGAALSAISAYTLHDGALLDFSLLGGALHPDNRHNRAVYGEGTTVDDILHGRVAAPDEFGPLYSSLRMLTAKTREQLAAL